MTHYMIERRNSNNHYSGSENYHIWVRLMCLYGIDYICSTCIATDIGLVVSAAPPCGAECTVPALRVYSPCVVDDRPNP